MAGDMPRVSINAAYKIFKYAEGANPETDEPYDTVDKVEIIEGEAAMELLKQIQGGK
jgi:hypothetical protein